MSLKVLARVLSVAVGLLLFPVAAQAAPPNVTPDPLSIDFGQQSVGQSTPTTSIKFENLSGADIEVTGFSISGGGAAQFQTGGNGCGPQTLNDGNACFVDVFFQPGSVGSFSASADLTTDEGVESVPLAGEGASGSLSGTPPAYTPQPYFFGGQFGSAQFQNTDPNFTVMSTNATITGPDAAFFSIGNNGCANQQTQYPGNTCNVDVFFNPTGPGTRNAQLNLFNSGSPNPAVVPLTATALEGPKAVVTPGTIDFGNVGIGSSSAVTQVTVENQGDYVLQIQQVFVISGAPNFFPLTHNQCIGAVVAPGSNCTLDVAFVPGETGTGPQNGSIFVITNSPGPVTQSFMSGTGYEQPGGGRLTIEGNPMALRELTCQTGGFPEGTNFTYRWSKDGKQIAAGRTYKVADQDVGARLTCAVTASNPVGSADIDSPESAVIAPAFLGRMAGSLVAGRVCRALQAPAAVGGATLDYGRPVTPQDPLRIRGRGQVVVSLDGEQVARGSSTAVVTPRRLDGFADGSHSLSVTTGGGSKSKADVTLASCDLSARAVIRGGPAVIRTSSSTGMDELSIRAGNGTRFFPRRLSGGVRFKTLHQPGEAFLLSGVNSRSNGVSVKVSRKKIRIKGLPQNAGVVRLNLYRRSVNGGRFAIKARLKGVGNRTVKVKAGRRR